MTAEPSLLIAGALLLVGALLSKTSSRFGVPSLLLFLFLGMAAGEDGILGIELDDFELASQVGVIALVLARTEIFAGDRLLVMADASRLPQVRQVVGET